MIELLAAVENPRCSAHESLRLRCSLINHNGQPVELPSPYDRSGAFRVLLHAEDLSLLRMMDRRTRQKMLVDGRVDTTLTLDRLEPEGRWDWLLDLASFHMPSCPGSYFVDAELNYAPGGLQLNSGPLPVTIAADPLLSLSVMRDNPVIEGLTLLMEAETDAGPAYFLRQVNPGRPSGSWYSSRVLNGELPDLSFLASAGFFQTESVDPGYRRWIVWRDGEWLRARPHDNGVERLTETRRARIPEGALLIPSAFWMPDGSLYVFFWSIGGMLECRRLTADGLVKVFEYGLPVPAGAPLAIGANAEGIHIAMAWRGVLYDRLDMRGGRLERIHAFRSRLDCRNIEYDPGRHRIKALFGEHGQGEMLQMVMVNLKQDNVGTYTMDRLRIRDRVEEFSFDQDRRGRFHLLVSTSANRLYYLSEERGPYLVAEGEHRFFPVVCAPLKVYLGLYRRDFGFRFVQFQRRRQESKFVGLEAHPPVVI